jgi:hypothetical protein
MLRFVRVAAMLVVVLAVTGRDARAQWGYGGWGWGGWGGTSAIGSDLQGAAAYTIGAGIYNYDTAMATSINADTAMKYNDYVATVTRESARLHAARTQKDFLNNRALYDAHEKQLQDNPSPQQIMAGDALNAAVAQLSDPRLGSSALRATNVTIPADLIAEVPFQNASERVTIMLDDLRAALKWPDVFEEERFAGDKKTFDDIVTRARKEDHEGDISAETLNEAKNFIRGLRRKLDAQPLKDPDDQRAAARFVKAYTALVGLLEKPDTRQALSDLRKLKNTHLSNLLGFMHAYNLRFGPATTPKERIAYQKLYGILDETRDMILAEAKLEGKPSSQPSSKNASDFYESLDEKRLQARPTPAPPAPDTPK